jgi:1,4-dihydroxy-2-naphthoyl-CoA hydrolase
VPAGVDPPVDSYPVPGTLDETLGFELLEAGPDRVRGRFAAEKRVQQPFGLVHGGAYMALAESMASVATFQAVAGDGNIAVGQANDNHFLRPVTEGLVHAEGAPIHRGRTSWVWDIRFTDDRDRLCAISRVTIAVRPRDTR